MRIQPINQSIQIPSVGVGKRRACLLVHADLPRQYSFGTTLRFTDPVPAESRQLLLVLLLLLLIDTFSVMSLQLKKLRWHNKSAIDLSNANPVGGHTDVPRSTGHIMGTTRYSDQQASKSRQKVMRFYKQWCQLKSKRFIKPPYSISRVTSID